MPQDVPSSPSTRLFMTHHGPVGAWSSLTFGLPSRGVSIDIERMSVVDSGNLYIGVSRGRGDVTVLPFFTGAVRDAEMENLTRQRQRISHWKVVPAGKIERRLTPCVDEYRADGFTLRVWSPIPALPDPASGASLEYETCPAILLELAVDNASRDQPCWAFIGLEPKGFSEPSPLDWMSGGDLCGIGCREEWALAALPETNRVYTVRGDLCRVEDGTQLVHPVGMQGAVMMAVAPRARETLTTAFGFYHHGPSTQGITGRYWYGRHFADVRAVCRYALKNADRLRQDCRRYDAEVEAACPDRRKRDLFSQSVRAYAANVQLLAGDDGRVLYSVCEGQFRWRNTLDLAADHLPWELARNPWVARNIIDLYVERYTYRDELRFPGDDRLRPGGLAFTHDMGGDSTYAPPGRGGYEQPVASGYCFMTTEETLNGAYCLAACALAGGDKAWAARHRGVMVDLLESLHARDHYDPARRDGLLKAESSKTGPEGHEITTYDCLDASLKSAYGNLYIAVKTWCANLLLGRVLEQLGEAEAARRARAMADRTAASLVKHFDQARGAFPSNLFAPSDSLMIAAIEPLGVPLYLGLEKELRRYGELIARLGRHVRSCLATGACIDAATGGLRLVSSSTNTWPSKGFLCAFVLEDFFGLDLDAECPTVMREFLHWMQVSAAERTLSDQIESDTRQVLNGSFYPRMVTSSLWISPRAR